MPFSQDILRAARIRTVFEKNRTQAVRGSNPSRAARTGPATRAMRSLGAGLAAFAGRFQALRHRSHPIIAFGGAEA
jgi:hypothetical protein